MRLFILCFYVFLSACATKPAKTTAPQISQPPAPQINQPSASKIKLANTPIPQIDGNGHTSLIKSLAFTRDGRYLVSAGHDKLIRIWDIAQEKTVRIIRGQIGGGHEGKIFAIALSPDNRYLAVAGWMKARGESGHKIRLYDFQTGELLSLLRGHTNVIFSLAFSPDGHWLASGQGGTNQTAIIWNLQNYQPQQILKGHTRDIYSLAFTPDSQRLVTASDDRDLRLWQVANGKLINIMRGHTDKVRAVSVTPDNQVISGSWDHSIRRWDGMDGRYLDTLVENQGSQIGSLSISPNGLWLLSGAGSWPPHAHLYQLSDGKRIHRYPGHDNVVLATAISPDNTWAATAGGDDRSIHLWNTQTGEHKYKLFGKGRTIWSVGFSPDGRYLAWGKSYNKKHINHRGPLEYQIRLPDTDLSLGNPKPIQPDQTKSLVRARTQHGDWQLVHQKRGQYDAVLAIQEDGDTKYTIERSLIDGIEHRSYTFTPDGQHIISGGIGGVLGYYSRDGRHLGNFIGHTGDVWSVAVSANGRFLLSGSADQTVRLWRIDNQELLLNLFHTKDDWVAWTPQGYFTASPDGEDMIGWQINRGPEIAADHTSGRQLRQHFYRPDIVNQTILLGSAHKAVAQAKDTAFSLDSLLTATSPKFSIKETHFLPTADAPLLRIGLEVESDAVQSYRVYLDGRYIQQIDATRSGHRIEHDKALELAIPDGSTQRDLRIVAEGKNGIVTIKDTRLTIPANLLNRNERTKGDLYLLSIGVNQYPHLNQNLSYAKQDADTFHRWLMQNHARDFNQVHAFLLHDDAQHKPTREQIHQALEHIKQAKPNDTAVVFLAGHGENIGPDYYFLSSDTKPSDKGFVPETAVKWTAIQDSLMQTRGLRILVVDTCYAKGAFNPTLVNNASAAGIAIFSATDSADYVAEEKSALGHGVLTYSLLQGLKGKADLLHRPNNEVTLAELDFFVTKEVIHHTQGRQRPAVHLDQQAKHYVIARLANAQ